MKLVRIVVRDVQARTLAILAPTSDTWIGPSGRSIRAEDLEGLVDFARGHVGRLSLNGEEIRSPQLVAEIEDEGVS